MLLFEELKVDAEFSNLGEALTSAFQIDSSQLPKPYHNVEMIKQLNIKENVQQFTEGDTNVISLLNESSLAEGEISFNLHDFFLKFTYDIHINNAFDLL